MKTREGCHAIKAINQPSRLLKLLIAMNIVALLSNPIQYYMCIFELKQVSQDYFGLLHAWLSSLNWSCHIFLPLWSDLITFRACQHFLAVSPILRSKVCRRPLLDHRTPRKDPYNALDPFPAIDTGWGSCQLWHDLTTSPIDFQVRYIQWVSCGCHQELYELRS